MKYVFIFIFSAVHALICGYLGAMCQPLYKKNDSKCSLTPDEYEIESIMIKCKGEKAAEACEKISAMAVDDFTWWNATLAFKSISNVPVGYGLTAINIALALSDFKENWSIAAITLVVFNVVSTYLISKFYAQKDLRAFDMAGLGFTYDKTADDYIAVLDDILSKNAPVVKHRYETITSLSKRANEFRQIYLFATVINAICTVW